MSLPSPTPSHHALDHDLTATTSPTSPPATSNTADEGTSPPTGKKRQRSASMRSGASAERRASSAAPSDIPVPDPLSNPDITIESTTDMDGDVNLLDDVDAAIDHFNSTAPPDDFIGTGGASAFPSAPPTPDGLRDANLSDGYDVEGEEEGDPLEVWVEDVPVPDEPQWAETSPEDKLAKTHELMAKQMLPGENWYIVTTRWMMRYARALGEETAAKSLFEEDNPTEAELGPVDNTDLLDEEGDLNIDYLEHDEFELVPPELWKLFVHWYGKPTHPMPRRVRNIGTGASIIGRVDLRPPAFYALRLVATENDDPSLDPSGSNEPPFRITLSTFCSCKELFYTLARITHPELDGRIDEGDFRIWAVPTPRTMLLGAEYPVTRLVSVGGTELYALADKDLDAAGIEPDQVFAVEWYSDEPPSTGWLVNASEVPKPGGLREPLAPLDDDNFSPAPLFGQKTDFFDRLQSSRVLNNNSTSLTPSYSSARDYKPSTSLVASNKAKQAAAAATPRVPGTLGLGNMGNTCFMNSALQCLAHVPELAAYFLAGVHTAELNRDNPLGMGGAIAEAFGALLARIWAPTGAQASYSPREFKGTLSRFAPQFSGYQQHDSQELVAFLLDGLHEDLNRIQKKPYVEKPDWNGGGEREMAALAKESWEGYLKRNDSVIVDLFQGQYRSTLVCPECQKVSITFDPFMYLTLPLPQTARYRGTVCFVPADPEKAPIRVPVSILKDSSFKDLRALVGRWLNVEANNLVTHEIWNHRIYKDLHDGLPISEVADGDLVLCWEIPCASQQSRSFKRAPEDPYVLPVFLADAPGATGSKPSYGKPLISYFGMPFFVAIPPEDAGDKMAIARHVTEQLTRWTDQPDHLYQWTAGDDPEASVPDEDDMEEVHIPISGEEAEDGMAEMVTEIHIDEDGTAVPDVQPKPKSKSPTPPDEAEDDITDAKGMLVEEDADGLPPQSPPVTRDVSMTGSDDGKGQEEDEEEDHPPPRRVGPKTNVFNLHIIPDWPNFGSGLRPPARESIFANWDERRAESSGEHDGAVLRPGDGLLVEFEPDKREFFFGSKLGPENARFDPKAWEEVVHPELAAQRAKELEQRRSGSKGSGLALQACLDEFVKEEQLGEDDLWYCPGCKKHQQAAKKFDLWRVPDVLVVHLKRFSASRGLRDKIDTLVDYPLEGLDLEPMIEERKLARRMLAQGENLEELGLEDDGEPMVYDLFAVDEHMGGLGGGHYRAYALNHETDKWYHFDDSYVTESQAHNAVNQNAYLLFYRRRTSRPLGGKTHEMVEAARKALPPPTDADGDEDGSPLRMRHHGNLPTPPSEGEHVTGSSFGPPRYTRARGESPAQKAKWSHLTPLDDEDTGPPFDGQRYHDMEADSYGRSAIDSLGLQGFGSSWNQGDDSLIGGLTHHEVKRKTPSPQLPVVEIPIEESQLDDID